MQTPPIADYFRALEGRQICRLATFISQTRQRVPAVGQHDHVVYLDGLIECTNKLYCTQGSLRRALSRCTPRCGRRIGERCGPQWRATW